MPRAWEIIAGWEPLNGGSDEERCCFASIGIKAHDRWLTEGRDALANRLRQTPLLSGYHLAEWLVWNWWRLRWEPRSISEDWTFCHRMANVGGGYVWPNITIFSDGERTALLAKPTADRPETPFRYISDVAAVIPSMDFENGVDNFAVQVLERLKESGLRNTNLSRIWNDLLDERNSPPLAQRRKLEALLGHEPDESNAAVIENLLADAARLSLASVEELAAESGRRHAAEVLSAAQLADLAKQHGASAVAGGRVRVAIPPGVAARGQTPAWEIGAHAALLLRQQEALGDAPVSDTRLAALLAVDERVLTTSTSVDLGISFALDDDEDRSSKILLRAKWRTGKRFELARLLGDSLLTTHARLLPATRTNTYRQKAQRSFAAELLSPFNAVLHMLDGDYSLEKQADVAEHFQVSPLTINTQLLNHRIIEREDLDGDSFLLTAA